jgi:hypothetical protein
LWIKKRYRPVAGDGDRAMASSRTNSGKDSTRIAHSIAAVAANCIGLLLTCHQLTATAAILRRTYRRFFALF